MQLCDECQKSGHCWADTLRYERDEARRSRDAALVRGNQELEAKRELEQKVRKLEDVLRLLVLL